MGKSKIFYLNSFISIIGVSVGYIVLRTYIFCLRKIICHAQSISLFRENDPHTSSRAHKICRIIHEIFSLAHNTLSRHTVNFEFIRGM